MSRCLLHVLKWQVELTHFTSKLRIFIYSHKFSLWGRTGHIVTWILCPNAMLLSADTSWILWACPSILILHTPSSTTVHISAPWNRHTCTIKHLYYSVGIREYPLKTKQLLHNVLTVNKSPNHLSSLLIYHPFPHDKNMFFLMLRLFLKICMTGCFAQKFNRKAKSAVASQ